MRPAILAALAALVAVTVPAGVATAGEESPDIVLSTTVLVPGRPVALSGTHWPQGTTLHAVLCGANAVDGSADCVEEAAVTMTPGPDGALQGVMQVVLPPRPCPCVVLVTGLTSSFSTTIPVDVRGAPTAPAVSEAPSTQPLALQVEARVTGGASLATVLGGAAHRAVHVTMRNTGKVPLRPVVTARWGRGSSPRQAIASPATGVLAPGEARTIVVPFHLDPLSVGNYTIAGEVTGAGRSVPFTSSTSTWPWGLLVVAQVVLLLVRNAVRRILARHEARERRAERRAAREAARRSTRPTAAL